MSRQVRKESRASRKLLCILGSPRRNGNTDILAREFVRGAQTKALGVKTIIPYELGLAPCDGANQCFRDGRCVINDGMNQIYDDLLASTHLLIATPVYFMGPPGSLKSFIDRFQAVWARSAILKRFDPDEPERRASHKAFLIVASASKEEVMIKPTISILKAFLNVVGFAYDGCLEALGIDEKSEVLEHPELLQRAFDAGVRFAG